MMMLLPLSSIALRVMLPLLLLLPLILVVGNDATRVCTPSFLSFFPAVFSSRCQPIESRRQPVVKVDEEKKGKESECSLHRVWEGKREESVVLSFPWLLPSCARSQARISATTAVAAVAVASASGGRGRTKSAGVLTVIPC